MGKIRKMVDKDKVLVSVPELLMEKLNNEKDKRGYPSIQVIINECIRERYFGKKLDSSGGAKRGPKPKFNHEKMVSGETMFEK